MREIKKETFFNLWNEHSPLTPTGFSEMVVAALEEFLGNKAYSVLLSLESEDLINPSTGQSLLGSMELAAKMAKGSHSPEEVRRLEIELKTTRKIIEILASGSKETILWFSPPGMGLNSSESRLNIFKRSQDNKIIVHSIPTTPKFTGLIELTELLTNKDASPLNLESTEGFLQTIFVLKESPTKIIQMLYHFNQVVGFSPPTLWPIISDGHKRKIRNKAERFWSVIQNLPPEKQYPLELLFINRLKEEIVQKLTADGIINGFIAYKQTHPTACGSLPSPPHFPSLVLLIGGEISRPSSIKITNQQPKQKPRLDLTP